VDESEPRWGAPFFLSSDPAPGEILSPARFWYVHEKGQLWTPSLPHSCLARGIFSTIMIKYNLLENGRFSWLTAELKKAP